ncbi:MAG: hypothetical protein WDZ74_01860 [Candidatus Paceibacterota bacterium]
MTENTSPRTLILPSVSTEDELKAELQKVLNLKVGKVRGVSLNNDSLKSVEALAGTGATEKVQAKLKELGFDVDITNLDSYEWYPAGYDAAIYLTAAHLFGWGEDDIENLGCVATRASAFTKIIMRFVSMKLTLRSAPEYWRKYYDFGELVPVGYFEDEPSIIFQIKGAHVHPIIEIFQKGYYRGVVELVTGSTNIVVHVHKSAARGDEYTEYKISW